MLKPVMVWEKLVNELAFPIGWTGVTRPYAGLLPQMNHPVVAWWCGSIEALSTTLVRVTLDGTLVMTAGG